MPPNTTPWNLLSKLKGAPHLQFPQSLPNLCVFSVGCMFFPLAFDGGAVQGFVYFLLPLRGSCMCVCLFQRSQWLEVQGTAVNRHQSQNLRISILSAKQLEVFEVLFGAYSSQPLCQRGIFIIKKKKLAVVHLAELNSKVIRVVYAFLIKSSFETDVRIKWYNTINIHGH